MNRLSQRNDSNDLINQLNIYVDVDLFEKKIFYFVELFWKTFNFVDLFGKRSISLIFFGKRSISLTFLGDILNQYQFNWFNHTSPSKSIDSVTYFMKTNWLSHQSTHLEKELNRFSQFCGKMKWFNSIKSVELIGIQVWCSDSYFQEQTVSAAISAHSKCYHNSPAHLRDCTHGPSSAR